MTSMKHYLEEEFISLNSELSEFDLQELEQRLETDPLAVGGLLDVVSSNSPLLMASATGCDFTCDTVYNA